MIVTDSAALIEIVLDGRAAASLVAITICRMVSAELKDLRCPSTMSFPIAPPRPLDKRIYNFIFLADDQGSIRWANNMNKSFFLAGVGGTLPTLSKLAGSFAIQPDQPLPHWHISLALAVFFIIGCVLNLSFNKDSDITKAIIVGISAPGLITNIVAGATTAPPPPAKIASVNYDYLNYFISSAHGAEADSSPASNENSNTEHQSKKIFIKSVSAGSYQQDVFRNRAMVIANVNGQQIKIGEVGVGDSSVLDAPPDTSALTFVAYGQNGTASQSIGLPSGKPLVEILAQFDVRPTGSGDLQWAFGAPREGSIMHISLTLIGKQ